MDENAVRILARRLDEPDRYPDEPEYPGEPKIHPEHQWALLRRYYAESLARTATPDIEQDEPVAPLEALTLARLITEDLRASYVYLIADARQDGQSWAQIGRALGMSRQAAWELYTKAMPALSVLSEQTRARYASLAGQPDEDTDRGPAR